MLCTGGGVRLDGFRKRRSLRDGDEGAFTKKEWKERGIFSSRVYV